MRKTAVFFLAVLFTVSGLAQKVELTRDALRAYRKVLALKLAEGEELLQQQQALDPDNLFPVYVENYVDFLTLFIGENESDFDRLEDNKSLRIKKIEQLADSNPYKKYMLGNIQLQWALARLKFGEYFTAAFEINKAYRLLEANEERFPDFAPNRITLGVLHIMIGMVPEKYHWILRLISMEGDVDQGREELYAVLAKCQSDSTLHYLRDETLFYLGFIELNTNPDKTNALHLLEQLKPARQDNLLLSYLVIDILVHTGQNDAALDEFRRLGDRTGFFPFYYLDYLNGECLLHKLQTGQAREKYARFLDNFSGRNYLKDAVRKTAWTYLLEGDTVRYLKTLEEVPSLGNQDVDSDKQAQQEARLQQPPRIVLLKARLLFDGGYYPQSDSVLLTANLQDFSPDEVTEYHYRRGRIAHELGKIPEAKSAYLLTIEHGRDSKRYFAGNAALKLAGIFENEGDLQTAVFYYKLCLELDFNEYETSIHTKARTGLKRVSRKLP